MARRIWCVVLVGWLVAGAARAETVKLAESVQKGSCTSVRLEMQVQGEIRVQRDGKQISLPLKAIASHTFVERVLDVDPRGLTARVLRYYSAARAVINVNRDESERTLRNERRLFVAQRRDDQAFCYSPSGPLTREEMELVAEHFDTLTVPGLLPGKEVEVGDSWAVAPPVVQALCHFDGLTEHDLKATLESVDNGVARIRVKGTATGIEVGALVKLQIDAAATYDVKAGKLTRLEWKQKDDRDQGPASPMMVLDCSLVLERASVEAPAELGDDVVAAVPAGFEVPIPLTGIQYADPKGRFDLVHARDWHVVGLVNDHLVMRLMDRGEMIAQVTITPWNPAGKGKHLSPEEFRKVMGETPGWQLTQEIQAGEVPNDNDVWMYRISAAGQLQGAEVIQNFYLLASPEGEQLVLAFTMSPKATELLGTKDLTLAGSIGLRSRPQP